MEKTYDPKQIEKNWYQTWEDKGYFKASGKGDPFCIMLPPPNVTGSLHMGHGFQQTLMDILTRYHRMLGDNTLWQTGTDHAGISTQMVVERKIAKEENLSRHDIGRDEFVEKIWEWKHHSGGNICRQMRRMGTSVDWSRERFTMDDALSKAVIEEFTRLYDEGLIYRGKRLVNWDPKLLTAISDLEVISEEEDGYLWHIRYPVIDSNEFITIATTRPETMLADTAVAVHPEDQRYKHLIGKKLSLPLVGREKLTYNQLNQWSNKLAYYLDSIGVGPEVIVGINTTRSLNLIISIIAIMKAGGAYIPLDPIYPKERLEDIVSDSKLGYIITDDIQRNFLENYAGILINFNDETIYKDQSSTNLNKEISSHQLAYIIYTSGSTGKPKGVMIEHDNLARLFHVTKDLIKYGHNDRWTLFHSYAFDFSVWEIWGPLATGATLHIVPHEVSKNPIAFFDFLVKNKISVLNQTPSAFFQLLSFCPDIKNEKTHSIKTIILGGESITQKLITHWFSNNSLKDVRLLNMYGITEITVHATIFEVNEKILSYSYYNNIGKAIPDLGIYILDESMELCPTGVTGELYISGAGVARGYLYRKELTSQRFINNPFVVNAEIDINSIYKRMYRTGDLARYLPDGSIEYLGRIDNQVKLRGFRIELGEIEARISELSNVRNVIVVTKGVGEHSYLLAYIELESKENSIHTEEEMISLFKQYLQQKLPEYMLPSSYIFIDKMPLTSNGKLDKNRLPEPQYSDLRRSKSVVPPRNELEKTLTSIWQETLNIKEISIYDNFFSLGGNSIIAAQLIVAIVTSGHFASIKSLYENPSIAALCSFIQKNSKKIADKSDLTNPNWKDSYPLTKMQEIMIKHYGNQFQQGVYHSQIAYRLKFPTFKLNTFEQSLQIMIDKYPTFRVQFFSDGDALKQRVVDKRTYNISCADISKRDPTIQDKIIRTYLKQDRNDPFDIFSEKSSLYRFKVFITDVNTIAFCVSLHHAIEDGWGMVEFIKDLFSTYLKLNKGHDVEVNPAENIHARYVYYEKNKILNSSEHKQFWNEYMKRYKQHHSKKRYSAAANHETTIEISLDKDLSESILSSSVDLNVSLKAVFLNSYVDVLSELFQSSDIAIGIVCNGGRVSDISGSFESLGLFWNLLPIFIDTINNKSEQLKNVHRHLTQIDVFGAYPLTELESLVGNERIFNATFNFLCFHNMSSLPKDIEILSIIGHDKFHYPLNLAVDVDLSKKAVGVRVDYDFHYFCEKEMNDFIEKYIKYLTRNMHLYLRKNFENGFFHSNQPKEADLEGQSQLVGQSQGFSR